MEFKSIFGFEPSSDPRLRKFENHIVQKKIDALQSEFRDAKNKLMSLEEGIGGEINSEDLLKSYEEAKKISVRITDLESQLKSAGEACKVVGVDFVMDLSFR